MQLGWLRRRWWVPLSTVAGATVFALMTTSETTTNYTATSVFIVPHVTFDTTVKGPRNGFEAQQLATTYALAISADDRIAEAVASKIGVRPEVVSGRIVINQPENTSLLNASYTGTSAREAIAASRALTAALTGDPPASPTIIPRSLQVVRLASRAIPVQGPSSTKAPVAALLGLGLGAVLVVALERADVRVDDVGVLGDEVGCPVSHVGRESTTGMFNAILGRWRTMMPRSSASVALLPLSQGAAMAANALRDRFSEAARSWERQLPGPARTGASAADRGGAYFSAGSSSLPGRQSSAEAGSHETGREHLVTGGTVVADPRTASTPPPASGRSPSTDGNPPEFRLVVGGVLGGADSGELLALDCDLATIVVTEGMPLEQVRSAMRTLQALGVTPSWCIFTSYRFGRRHSERRRNRKSVPGTVTTGI